MYNEEIVMTYKMICESITVEKRLKLEDNLRKLEEQGFEYVDLAMANKELDYVCILMHKKETKQLRVKSE